MMTIGEERIHLKEEEKTKPGDVFAALGFFGFLLVLLLG